MRHVRFRDADGAVREAALEQGEEPPAGATLLRPIDPPEVWCSGVTYERSRDARIEESGSDVYALVYDADRPELFLKDAGCRRTVGPGERIAIRSDATWNVPEPEIGVVLGEQLDIVGYTIGNDVSSRDIEGANPLYLPQAKVFAAACAIGPAVYVPEDWDAPLAIELTIRDAGGVELFSGRTSTAKMRRTFTELVAWLVRDNPVPPGSVLLTGTGLVPPDDFTLLPGHVVEIHVPEIGTLCNPVARAGDLLERSFPMTETPMTVDGRNFVAGAWSESSSGATYEKHNPWRPAEVTGVYAASTADDARAAVAAARDAFPAWAALPAPARAAFFFKAADAIEARVERIAQDMTAEMGKPLREARMEAARAAAILRYSAGEAYRPAGEVYEPSVGGQTLYTRRRPVGVVGLITPWNFPVAIPVWKLAPALIYGNTVVLKLGYEAPRTGLHVAECFAEAGLPPGVLNVLTGSGSTAGAELVSNPHVRALSFTGSVAVGHAVRNEATARNCRVQLELGGHNPFIVMADAELDRAAEAAFAGAFWSAGQKCTATRRILVREAVYDAFREKFLARIAAGKVGDPADPATEVGPVVAAGPFEDILAAIERGKAEGGTIAAGGGRAGDDGYLISPTVFENVADDAFLSCEEVFGPVTSLYRFSTLDEALERANAVEFGLSAAIFTRDLHATQRFANELQAGILHVNSQTAGADVHVPFGGLKGSAWGPHEQGRAAMEFYTETVTVYQDAPLA